MTITTYPRQHKRLSQPKGAFHFRKLNGGGGAWPCPVLVPEQVLEGCPQKSRNRGLESGLESLSNKSWDSSCPSPGGSNPKPPTLSGDLPSGLLSLYSPPPTPTNKQTKKGNNFANAEVLFGKTKGIPPPSPLHPPPKPPTSPHCPPPTPRHSPSQVWLRENSLTYLRDPYQGGWGPDRLGEVGEEAGFLRGVGREKFLGCAAPAARAPGGREMA